MEPISTRIGDWALSASGLKFYPLDLRIHEIAIGDIAASLSKICRFGGHCKEFYSVAQHSVLVLDLVSSEPIEVQRQALLHDATEAYCGDMIRPLKTNMPEYRTAEQNIWSAICQRFGLPYGLFPVVDYADASILLAEKRDILVESAFEWGFPQCKYPGIETPSVKIVPLDPKSAEQLFLAKCAELEIV